LEKRKRFVKDVYKPHQKCECKKKRLCFNGFGDLGGCYHDEEYF